jgi:hypothetical protein
MVGRSSGLHLENAPVAMMSKAGVVDSAMAYARGLHEVLRLQGPQDVLSTTLVARLREGIQTPNYGLCRIYPLGLSCGKVWLR